MKRILNRRQRVALFKFFALLSLVRWYNILILVLAQYLASVFILNPDKDWLTVILDPKLFLVVLSSSFIIASGFIINAFYDVERDIINKPGEVVIHRLISEKTALNFYFLFNTLGMITSFYVSKRIMLFNFLFSIALWFYSHKMRKISVLNDIAAVALTIAPFLIIVVYFDNINYAIFFYVAFIAIIEFIREIIKDILGEKGDIIYGYHTVPIDFGIKKTKRLLYTAMVLTPIPPVLLYLTYAIDKVAIYFAAAIIMVMMSAVLVYRAKEQADFKVINTLYKIILALGILSIPLV
ncbi:geranylgeranylglycerol-phosphate geranylgeranyltransferase [Salibacter sp.]|uniref:geranylgeranylglycerol-phosphate geranylgeranyltransferase n=1 Tax=Salibacter sp. TaxID=2010995 RepID=UPI00286FC587|nr:geranylgeranylglycerol-phosphate geranylgeranyltransferase [Salibacter sp.]MDR9487874.1 geranylgeranylglycerol-phosphate geranylgeranyltransferase [Salibacter sp.]